MEKIIIKTIGNLILFILLGLAFLFPFSELQQTQKLGFTAKLSIFPIILVVYLILYPIIFYIIKKLLKWNKKDNSELDFSDEREKTIVAEATKVSYITLMGGMIVSIAILGGVKFFELFTHEIINVYFLSILLMTSMLVLSTTSYCIKWCKEYVK